MCIILIIFYHIIIYYILLVENEKLKIFSISNSKLLLLWKKFENRSNEENCENESKRIVFKLGRSTVCRTWLLETVIITSVQSSLFHKYIYFIAVNLFENIQLISQLELHSKQHLCLNLAKEKCK